MADKRKSSSTVNGGQYDAASTSSSVIKRARQDEDGTKTMQLAISSANDGTSKGLIRSVKRTSNLSSPIISLSGSHSSELLDVKFSPDGQMIAAASSDRTISIWQTFGENRNIGILSGHAKAVTAITWSPSAAKTEPKLFSSSADATLIVWDVLSGTKLRRLRGHKGIINCIASAPGGREILASGGDDGKVMLWDPNERDVLDVIDVNYPVTAVCFSDDGGQIYVGGLDNEIHVYDLMRKEILFSLKGHSDTITSLELSPSGSNLLSTAMDNTLCIWDVQPFAPEPMPGQSKNARLYRTLQGATTSGFENLLIKSAWSKDGRRVATGGTDRTCTIWNVDNSTILYKLPGHRGTCTAVALHPQEPIIVSASVDATMFLGEIEP